MDELERLERDLGAVEVRLADGMRWEGLLARARRDLWRPGWDLAWSLVLFLACAVVGFRTHSTWLTASGILLFVLPRRIRALRERRAAVRAAREGELFLLWRRELELRRSGQVLGFLVDTALGLLFLLCALFLPDPRASLVVGVLCLILAAVRLFVLLPRNQRVLTALGESVDDEDDEDDDDEEDGDES